LVRLAVVALITSAIAAALWPSATGFRVGADGERSCVAVIDGWHANRVDPGPAAPRTLQNSYLQWSDGDGACIRPSRHRLIVSGIALLAVAIIMAGAVFVVRARKPRRKFAP
jgi:hypothetical protein